MATPRDAELSPPTVLGVDPGSRVTGFGVVMQLGTRLIHVLSGSIRCRTSEPLERRLRHIHDELSRIIRDASPTVLAIETEFYSKNVRSAVLLAHVRGVAMLAAAEAGIAVAEYTPAEVKKAVVGYGRAAKEQVEVMVSRLLRLPEGGSCEVPDTSDALAVAMCHLGALALNRRLGLERRGRKEVSV